MEKKRTSKNVQPADRKTKGDAILSRDTTANDVIENLFGLFEHLGIDTSRSATTSLGTNSAKPASISLYQHTSAISDLLTSWHQDPKYLDQLGNPVLIRLRGPRPSLTHLAQRAAVKIDVLYLLTELERIGAVTVEKGNLIRVRMRCFPVYEDKRLAVQHTLTTLNGFITTLRHNLKSTPSNSHQLFHRIASTDDFDSRELPALKVRVKRHGQHLLESFDDWLTRKSINKSRNLHSHRKASSVSIGVYLSVGRGQ
jgi:hypothetical protein